jgi:hypothetical protein
MSCLPLEYLCIDGRIILKQMFNEKSWEWNGFIRIGMSDGLL